MRCAVTQDLDRYQGEVDAEAAREMVDEAAWAELKPEIIERVMLRHSIRVTDRRGERCIIDWETITGEACCQKGFELALDACVEDHAEGGRLMHAALLAEAEAQVEAHKDDLMDELRRSQREFDAERSVA